jgi:hypothetical protein
MGIIARPYLLKNKEKGRNGSREGGRKKEWEGGGKVVDLWNGKMRIFMLCIVKQP